jgi:hypothetical protein
VRTHASAVFLYAGAISECVRTRPGTRRTDNQMLKLIVTTFKF